MPFALAAEELNDLDLSTVHLTLGAFQCAAGAEFCCAGQRRAPKPLTKGGDILSLYLSDDRVEFRDTCALRRSVVLEWGQWRE